LFPLYTVSEYVVRRPLGALVTTAERNHWPALILDFVTFGPNRKAGLVPTALFDFRLRPSVGLLLFWNDFLVPKNDLRLRAAWGGAEWHILGLSNRLALSRDQSVRARAWLTERPDYVYHGLGPDTDADRARYQSTRLDGELSYMARLWRTSRVDTRVALRDERFALGESCCEDPSVADEVERGRYARPPGSDGYGLVETGVQVALDTRPRRKLDEPHPGSDFLAPPGSGVRVALRGSHAARLDRPERSGGAPSFVSYGGTLGGYWDLTGLQRVVGLELVGDFADPVGEPGPIPFTELPSLGGARPMRGLLEGRLRGRSTAVARLEYRWPVWVYVDGTFQYDVGNAFDAGLRGFELAKLRQSFALGLRMNNVQDHAFELLGGIGTTEFSDGSKVDSVRLVLGASSGF
jgi:hypothetical protein